MKKTVRKTAGQAIVTLLLGIGPVPVQAYDWAALTSDGVATVPSGVTAVIDDAGDIAAVEALTEIVFADETSAVRYTAGEPLDLRAELSGEGTFSAVASGKLVLWGDNSRLTAPGHFFFTNSPVVVSNRFGLGCASSGAAEFVYNSASSLAFGCPGGAFTNEVDLTFSHVAGGWPVLGSERLSETLVMSNDCYLAKKAATFLFKNNCEFIAGEVRNESGFFYNAQKGNNVSLRYAGTSRLYSPDWLWLGGNASTVFHLFSATNASAPRVILGQGGAGPTVVFGRTNVFDTARNPMMDLCKNATWDLNGYDQRFSDIGVQYFGSPIDEANVDVTTVRSATEAMLVSVSCTDGRAYPILFEGRAGWCHDAAKTNALVNVLSTSRGLLDVAKGRVVLKWNAGWSGDAVVRAGAELEVASPAGFSGGLGELVVEEGGKLILGDGAGVMLSKFAFGDKVYAEPGSYTLAELKAAGCAVEGDDRMSIGVLEDFSGTWEGWPATAGAEVKIPSGATVFIRDEDVPRVSALSAIRLAPSSRVICSNVTARLVLSAAVSGYGSFEVYDSAGIDLAGDNAGLSAPGRFFFTNSSVRVSGRHGLGAAAAASARVWMKPAAALVFAGAGLTNDAPVVLHTRDCGSGWPAVGGENPGDVFVQNADFLLSDPADSQRHVRFTSHARFTAGYFGSLTRTGTMLHLNAVASDVGIHFDRGVLPRAEILFVEGGTLCLDSDMDVVTCLPNTGIRIVCAGDDAVSYTRHAGRPGAILDLNGYDQFLGAFSAQYDVDHVGTVVTSAVPATLTLTGTGNVNDRVYGVVFRGAAGLTFDAADVTNTIDKTYSDTAGALDVARGTLRFAGGAGWGGTNVTVRSGAALDVAATSAACVFAAPDALPSRTELVIENGATLSVESGTVEVKSCRFDGAYLQAGRCYGAADGVGISGGGFLRPRTSGRCFLVILR